MTLPGESTSWCGEDEDVDGFVVLVVDLVTGHSDCYGPYRDATHASGQAEWRRLEFDIADLPDVVVGLVPWHDEDGRPTDVGAGGSSGDR
jgi:hypothetical protein